MELALLVTSFIAGVLTVLAPCMLPLIPILVGGSATRSSKIRPLVITGSLLASIILFTLLVKSTSLYIDVDQGVWVKISAIILILFGLVYAFPKLWESIAQKLYLNSKSNKLLGKFITKDSWFGDVMIGVALGPVFTSCSPTFALIVATILPVSFFQGFIYLIVYALGLGIMLLAISYIGQSLVTKLGWATDPKGWFKRALGLMFVAIGVILFFNWHKTIESAILDTGFYETINRLENKLQN